MEGLSRSQKSCIRSGGGLDGAGEGADSGRHVARRRRTKTGINFGLIRPLISSILLLLKIKIDKKIIFFLLSLNFFPLLGFFFANTLNVTRTRNISALF